MLVPDITYRVNDPGMSAVWCVVPAVKAAIATGIVDPKHDRPHGPLVGRLPDGVPGHADRHLRRGGRRRAADQHGQHVFARSTRTPAASNGAIFESSQGRFKGGFWDNWDAYYRNSPVFFAKNVKTPLMILHNDKDGAVDFTQGIEYFNTLRRLQKPVIMLEYVGENHGLAQPANQRDYTVRMKEYFDHYLMGAPAPDWMVKRRAAPEDGRAPEGAREAEARAEEDHDDAESGRTLKVGHRLFNTTGSPNPSSFSRGSCVFASPTTSQIILIAFRYFRDRSLICSTVIALTICSRSLT